MWREEYVKIRLKCYSRKSFVIAKGTIWWNEDFEKKKKEISALNGDATDATCTEVRRKKYSIRKKRAERKKKCQRIFRRKLNRNEGMYQRNVKHIM